MQCSINLLTHPARSHTLIRQRSDNQNIKTLTRRVGAKSDYSKIRIPVLLSFPKHASNAETRYLGCEPCRSPCKIAVRTAETNMLFDASSADWLGHPTNHNQCCQVVGYRHPKCTRLLATILLTHHTTQVSHNVRRCENKEYATLGHSYMLDRNAATR